MENQSQDWMQLVGGMIQYPIQDYIPSKLDENNKCKNRKQKNQEKSKRNQTQQFKKQRNKNSKLRISERKREIMKNMSKQEAENYIKTTRQLKQATKLKMAKSIETGLPILIDCCYSKNMNERENKSLPMQIQLIYQGMRNQQNPCSLHICGVDQNLKQSMLRMEMHHLPMTINSQNVIEIGMKLNKQLIYLSPDAEQQLDIVSDKYGYVIGGLVDRTVLKDASLMRSKQLGIKARKLPIQQYMRNRKCLNIDHVALMLVKAQVSSWRTAFDSAAPKRFNKNILDQKVSKKQSEQMKTEIQLQILKQEK